MNFGTKSYLKSTRNHTAKYALNREITDTRQIYFAFFFMTKIKKKTVK